MAGLATKVDNGLAPLFQWFEPQGHDYPTEISEKPVAFVRPGLVFCPDLARQVARCKAQLS